VKTALLLSGGIDSTAVAFWKRPAIGITIDYGHVAAEAELYAASTIARALGLSHKVIRVDTGQLGVGLMAGTQQLRIAPSAEWWPFRNQLLITLAAMFSIKEGCSELLIGSVSSDERHADGTSIFLKRIDELIALQEGNLRLIAPAMAMSSEELVSVSGVPLSVLAWCHSCHRGNQACGGCRGCQKNRDVRNAVGLMT
jgi:7-cyano-7-deazaguanine synthase